MSRNLALLVGPVISRDLGVSLRARGTGVRQYAFGPASSTSLTSHELPRSQILLLLVKELLTGLIGPLLVVAAVLAVPGSLLADVAPPVPVPETCTVEKKEQPGTVCERCEGIVGGDTTCEEQYEGTDYAFACSEEDGASTFHEVWCDGPPREGCQVAGPAGVSLLALWLTGAGLLALRRRG